MSERTLTQPVKFLDLTLPELTAAEAAEIARREFGLTGEAKQLYSERDANFHLRPAGGGPGHVLKIANAVEDPDVIDLQTASLRHIARADPELPVPRVILSRSGEAVAWVTLASGARHMARVYSFLTGERWSRCRKSRRCWLISAASPRGSTRRSPVLPSWRGAGDPLGSAATAAHGRPCWRYRRRG